MGGVPVGTLHHDNNLPKSILGQTDQVINQLFSFRFSQNVRHRNHFTFKAVQNGIHKHPEQVRSGVLVGRADNVRPLQGATAAQGPVTLRTQLKGSRRRK